MENSVDMMSRREKALELAAKNMFKEGWGYFEEKVLNGVNEFFEKQCISLDKKEFEARMEKGLTYLYFFEKNLYFYLKI